MYLRSAEPKKETFHWQHLLAWMGGMLCALIPFLGSWEIGSMKIPVRFGPGNFGFNILIVTGLCTLGGVVGGYWWRFSKWLLGKRDLSLTLMTLLLPALGISGLFSSKIHGLFLYLFGGVILGGLITAFLLKGKTSRDWPDFYDFLDWLRERNRLNAVFFIILLLVLVASNTFALVRLDVGAMEKVSAMVGRLLTCGVLAGILYLLSELTMRSAPRYFRWVPWLVFSMAPLVIIADQWMGLALNRQLLEFVNGLTASGDFDPVVELSASGLDVGPLGAFLLILGIIGGAMVMAWAAWHLSKRWDMKISIGSALMIAGLCWCGAVAEQGVGSLWKSKAAWQAEHKLFNVHLGIFAPPKGVGHYAITFRAPKEGLESLAPSAAPSRPDIYIFMVESMRADAMSQKTTPFLWKIKEEECQKLGKTWATSNATHLAWYGLFHSQIPVYWRSELEGIPDRQDFMGAPALQWMKKSGYDIQVRAVCDLGYKDFGLLNFGGGLSLADVWEDTQGGVDFGDNGIPGREVIIFDNLRKSVRERPEGGGFYFTGLDSPHYNYYWHDTFNPPYDDYEEDVRFPFNPSEEVIMRYKRRYWNSVAWVDHQIKEFCDFLKKEGRYKNAVIIVTGDHGEEFQEQGSWCHCSSLQPEQIQVPLLIKWPKRMGRGGEFTEASHLDIMPSLLQMLDFPSSETHLMAGKSLLRQSDEGHTQIATTAYAGKSGETMILRRNGYQATFSWPNYWDARVPEDIVLERITGPDGDLLLADPQAYAKALREYFPDAFERFFNTLEVIED